MSRLGQHLRLGTLIFAVFLAACTPTSPTPTLAPPTQAAQTVPTAAVRAPPGFRNWEDVLEQARGTTVNWYMWGGSAALNEFVDAHYGDPLQAEYGITLNRVPVADTVDAVNTVLSEAEAGVTEEGSVDLIWINGTRLFVQGVPDRGL
jgi:putative spermidine/putrescine transport system substrate-binding protein